MPILFYVPHLCTNSFFLPYSTSSPIFLFSPPPGLFFFFFGMFVFLLTSSHALLSCYRLQRNWMTLTLRLKTLMFAAGPVCRQRMTSLLLAKVHGYVVQRFWFCIYSSSSKTKGHQIATILWGKIVKYPRKKHISKMYFPMRKWVASVCGLTVFLHG